MPWQFFYPCLKCPVVCRLPAYPYGGTASLPEELLHKGKTQERGERREGEREKRRGEKKG